MSLKNTADSFGLVSRFFHWVMALLVIGLLAVGIYMTRQDPSPDVFKLYGLHKATGFIVLILAVLRLIWSLINTRPALLGLSTKLEKLSAHGAHILLYLCLFGMPLSGWAMSSAFGHPPSIFGLFTLPALMGQDKELGKLFGTIHEYMGYSLIALVCAHAGAALYHHIFKKDRTLLRMIKGK